MAQISIDLHNDKDVFSLKGDLEGLTDKRRALIYVRDFLHGTVTDDEITIPFEKDNQESVLINVIDLLEDYRIEEKKSAGVKSILKVFLREEKNFSEFSSQANSIRNNVLTARQKKEFGVFAEKLKSQLPNRRLYELQLLSAYHLAFSQNACNFSVPGAGKSTIVYGAYSYLKSLSPDDPRHVNKLLIIGPLSSFGPWEMEYEECFGEIAKSKRLSGGTSKAERTNHLYSSKPAEISLLSYNSIPYMQEDLIFFLSKYPTMVILDEAHKIKNIEGGLWATSALEIARYCSSRVILTGTPAPNGYEDIYNLFKFIWPTKEVIKYYPYHLREMSDNPQDERIGKLIKDISPYFMRIRKSDLDLPDPVENDPIIVRMGDIQREIYSYIEKNYMDYFISQGEDTVSIKSLLSRARLIRLMQASTNPSLLRKPINEMVDDQGYSENLFIDDSEMFIKILNYPEYEVPTKFISSLELIKEILSRNEKVVVWTIFIQNILDFQLFLDQNKIPSKVIFGATPIESDELEDEIETRESIIAEFHKEDSEFQVLIANTFAISESISLHKACNNAIYLERSFNAGNFIQSKDRIHRYGLLADDQVNYYYVLSDTNIDHTIHHRLIEKEKRMLRIIENEPIPLFGVMDESNGNDEDLRALIRSYVESIASS